MVIVFDKKHAIDARRIVKKVPSIIAKFHEPWSRNGRNRTCTLSIFRKFSIRHHSLRTRRWLDGNHLNFTRC